jgi:putative tryptophan/tyrosine transport system substrate-binding protein
MQMQRRQFLTLIGGTAASWPLTAQAQRSGKVPRVGVLWHAGSADEEAVYLSALVRGLGALGYVDGSTIMLEHRFPNEQPERFVSMAAELAGLSIDVLVAVTPLGALAAQRASSSIPIVFIVVPDPVGTGLVSNLARPGGNITGLTHIAVELNAKRIALFKEAFPRFTRAALLVNPNDPRTMQRYIDEARVAAATLALEIQPVEIKSLATIEQAFDRIVSERLEGVVAGADGLFYQGRAALAQAALARHLPFIVYSRETLEAGALMSYGADVREVFRKAAGYVDKILRGEKAADLPVEQPTKFEFLVNLKTAKALGVELPPTLLARADQVIE